MCRGVGKTTCMCACSLAGNGDSGEMCETVGRGGAGLEGEGA